MGFQKINMRMRSRLEKVDLGEVSLNCLRVMPQSNGYITDLSILKQLNLSSQFFI
jgi:hypothetical protein